MRASLIFDLDGTLVDSLPGIAAALNRALARLGLAVHDTASIRGFIGNGSYELASRAAPVGASEAMVLALEAAFKDNYATTWAEGTTPYPGVVGLLDRLATEGARMAVLSNKPHAFTVEIVERLFPGVPFDPVRGERPGTPRKPDPGGALQIALDWGMPPEDCHFIGDSTIDLATARAAGMPAVAVGWGYHEVTALEAAGAVEIAGTSAELAAVLGIV